MTISKWLRQAEVEDGVKPGVTTDEARQIRDCVFGKKRRVKKGLPGAPAHDDLVRRQFTASGPSRLWLTDISEHTHRGREALHPRDQRRVVQPDRGLLHRRADYLPARGRRPRVRGGQKGWKRRRRLHAASGQGRSIPQQEAPAVAVATPNGGLDGSGRISRRQRHDGELLQPAPTKRPRPTEVPLERISASRSSPGSNGPITADVAKHDSTD